MTTTLQEALLKAGFAKSKSLPNKDDKKKTIVKPAAFKSDPSYNKDFRNNRPNFPRDLPREEPKSQMSKKEDKAPIRTFCEACKRTGPDVELYEHNNRLINAKWLCVRCADSNNIHDNTRQTHQSQHAKNGMFRREYGPTKVFR